MGECRMNLYAFLRNIYYRAIELKQNKYLDDLVRKGLKLGKNVNLLNNVFLDPSHCFLISIGDNCTLSDDVRILSHDASTKIYLGYTKIAPVDIKENCFIGAGTIILPGVSIGPNSIIGAGSVVTRDVPPHTVSAGNPAKIISTLEDYLEKIKQLSKDKKIFTDEYAIGKLDEKKMDEIIRSIGDTMGFMV
jgi:maltose O-acetyltransferase